MIMILVFSSLVIWCSLVFCVWQLWWTRQHLKNLQAHNERVKRMYVDRDLSKWS